MLKKHSSLISADNLDMKKQILEQLIETTSKYGRRPPLALWQAPQYISASLSVPEKSLLSSL
jgi:hypothetical protein